MPKVKESNSVDDFWRIRHTERITPLRTEIKELKRQLKMDLNNQHIKALIRVCEERIDEIKEGR